MENKNKILNNLFAVTLSFLITLIAAFRSPSLGFDTKLYIEVLDSYWTNGTDKFPDLIFDFYTLGFTYFFNKGEIETRLFLGIISLLQGFLFYQIIKKKSPIEGLVITVGYGPLIFFDIIRQGLSMLLICYCIVAKRNNYFILLALATHINAFVTLFKDDFYRAYRKNINAFLIISILLAFTMWSGLVERFNYYISSKDYLQINLSEFEFYDVLTVFNIFVIFFILFSKVIGKFTTCESTILLAFYVLSICLPLFFRFYFFYFFIISCTKNYLVFNQSFRDNLFNILYLVVILNFSTKTTLFYY